jgi:hypothetical protein
MRTATLLRLLGNMGSADDPHQAQAFGHIPELPSLGQRWTAQRKAAVIEAVRGGWVPIEEICRLYNLSADEFVAWERDSDRRSIFTACSARALKHILRLKRRAGRADIDRARTLTQRLALTMLARDGIAAIWQLHLASAEADQGGYPTAAASISEIAEAAGEAWMRAEGAHAAVSAI